MWIDDYKQFLETLIEKKIVKNYRCMSSTTDVDILVTFTKGTLLKLLTEKKSNNNYTCLEKKMRLYTTKTTTNMHLFDENQKMKKFKSVEKIIEQHYPIRYTLYEKRKKYMIKFFPTINESIESYFKNLNTHPAYKNFREARKQLRESNLKLDPIHLVRHLNLYARDKNYVKTIESIIRTNRLIIFDGIKF